MAVNQNPDKVEKPLRGAVLCCTSIPPEQRTQYAEFAAQMGAEHKLDLTSDVTHLLVGDSNTPKYKYVAREREDVKVLKPEWLEAVRQVWMKSDPLDVQTLEQEYRLPTFTGLTICLTGFEDLTFRAQLQEKVTANGGHYKGDLTKTVTHLIAFSPVGKKYQYAAQWGVQIVSLRWFKDCLDRGMILDESLYHPTMSKEEQGKGAWNRKENLDVHTEKRPRDEQGAQDQPRKLRRIASAKLEHQRDTLWGDIVGKASKVEAEESEDSRLRKSLPRARPFVQAPNSFVNDNTLLSNGPQADSEVDSQSMQKTPQPPQGYFASMLFFTYGFDAKKEDILRKCLVDNGAIVFDSLTDMKTRPWVSSQGSFMVVPYDRQLSDMPSMEASDARPRVVTDMWIERCLDSKGFEEPDCCPISTPASSFPIAAMTKLIINSTGLGSIDLLHVSKMAKLLGAKYGEVLKPGISVLICDAKTPNVVKLGHAKRWNIPVVSVNWLWSCMRSGKLQPYRNFLHPLKPLPQGERAANTPGAEADAKLSKKGLKSTEQHQGEGGHTMSVKDNLNHKRREDPEKKTRPGADFHTACFPGSGRQRKCKDQVGPGPEASTESLPLREIGNNSPFKPATKSPVGKQQLFCALDGPTSLKSPDKHPSPTADSLLTGKTNHIVPPTETIRETLQELLNMKAMAKTTASSTMTGASRTKRLLGRASSSLSTCSKDGTLIQATRASSVDSMNTDGLGSVIADEASQHDKAAASTFRARTIVHNGLTGHAPIRDVPEHGFMDLGFSSLYQRPDTEEFQEPQRTQLEYADTDEAIALRRALAEKRRGRTREGQEDFLTTAKKEVRKLEDDETILGSGWGAGGRTRQKHRGSRALHDF